MHHSRVVDIEKSVVCGDRAHEILSDLAPDDLRSLEEIVREALENDEDGGPCYVPVSLPDGTIIHVNVDDVLAIAALQSDRLLV